MKKRISCIATLAIIVMFLLSGCQKEVTDFKYTFSLNSKNYTGEFSGTVKKGIPADGQGRFVSGTEGSGVYYSYNGEWKNGIPSGEGTLTDENFEINLSESNKKLGVYSGEVNDGIPNGTGTFKTKNQTEEKWNYEGEWKAGKPSGKGTLTDDTYENILPGNIVRSGSFTGEVVNGIPNGHGVFNTQNSEGVKYYYDGEWKDGKWNGKGKVVYENKEYGIEEGTFTDNDYTPNVVEFIQTLGTFDGECRYTLSEKQIAFIEKNESIIKGQDLGGLENIIDHSFSAEQFKKNPRAFSPAFVKFTNASIVQIQEYESYGGQTLTFCIADSEDYETTLFLYMLGTSKEAVQNSIVDIYLLPLSYTTYKNTSDSNVWAIAGTAVKIDVK